MGFAITTVVLRVCSWSRAAVIDHSNSDYHAYKADLRNHAPILCQYHAHLISVLSDGMLPFILCIPCVLNNASKVAQAFMSVVNNRAPGSEADEYCAGVHPIMQECKNAMNR